MSTVVTRRTFLRNAALGSVGLALAPHVRGQPARLARKPNLIVFLPDQQRADTIACYGAPRSFAPNLDKLASQSFVFQRAYVTQPVCTPSRSSLMTGCWPHANGCTQNNLALDSHFQCLPEMLGDNDYISGYMGKWHLGNEVHAQHGFEDWVSIIDGRVPKSVGRQERAPSDYAKFLAANGVQLVRRKNGSVRKFETSLPLQLSKPKFLELQACDFLEKHREDPFILYVAFFEPHPPYNGPLNDEIPVDESDIDPTGAQVFGDNMPLRYRLRQNMQQRKIGATAEQLKIKQRYLGLVSEVDMAIGGILTKLDQLGLADNTIVVHNSDHGDMMGAHRLIGKCVMFEEALRVPYLIRMPNQRKSISIAQPVSQIDFLPTMADLLGGKPHPQCVGKSRAPLLRGESMPAGPVFAQWNPGPKRRQVRSNHLANPQETVRAIHESTRTAIFPDGWKISLRDADKNELYHLHKDPREERNLYDSVHKDIVSRLTGEIHRWQESAGDSLKV